LKKYLQKIRKNLIDRGNIKKYLLYAVGEIILISIGILFAFYLNNLKTESNIRIDEIKILEELNSNLKSSIITFERAIKAERIYYEYNLMILDYLDNKKPYNDSLDKAFGTYFWTISSNPITGGYDYLKSQGIELITNNSLRKEISFVFEHDFSILKKENEVWANNLQQNITYPYYVNHFRKYFPEESDSGSVDFAKPFDYDALVKDDIFKSHNAEIISNRKWNINSLQNVINRINNLMTKIDEEVRSLKEK